MEKLFEINSMEDATIFAKNLTWFGNRDSLGGIKITLSDKGEHLILIGWEDRVRGGFEHGLIELTYLENNKILGKQERLNTLQQMASICFKYKKEINEELTKRQAEQLYHFGLPSDFR